MQIAVVATARKLAVLCWHLVVSEQDYASARPSLTANKQRSLELRAGLPPRRGRKGSAAAYSLKDIRRRENEVTAQAEAAYRQMVIGWQPRPGAGSPARVDPARCRAPDNTAVAVDAAAVTGARLSRPSRGSAARQG
jgi:transposase